MNHQTLAPRLGVVACLAVIATIAAPYAFVPDAAAVGAYYDLGAVTPFAIGLFALIGTVAFAAGMKERTDPELVAGLMLVVGVVSFLIALVWVLSFDSLRQDLVAANVRDFLALHRFTVLGAATIWTIAAFWYTWSLGLLGR